jgi:esterase/lipase
VSLDVSHSSTHDIIFGKKPLGIICINAALKISDVKFKFVRVAKMSVDLINKFRSKENGLKDYILDEPENPHINYNKNYLNGLSELSYLIDHCNQILPQITTPIFIIQGNCDPIVSPISGDMIYHKIGSIQKQIYTPDRSRHVIVRGSGSEQIFDQITRWVKVRSLGGKYAEFCYLAKTKDGISF